MITEIFDKYKAFYDGPVTRPQPIDFTCEYFKNKKGAGFFIDVGAHDGITWNNTLVLSEALGWRGICIEAHPVIYESLVTNRPHDICLNLASHNFDGGQRFWQITGPANGLSGLVATYDEPHKDRIDAEIAKHGGDKKEIVVMVEKLAHTLQNNPCNDFAGVLNKDIDYLSIDVEGAELSVLEGLDLDNNRPQLISIEDNGYHTKPHDYLISRGYKHVAKLAADCFYIP